MSGQGERRRWVTVHDDRVRREHMEDPDAWIGRLAEHIAKVVAQAAQDRPGECQAITFRIGGTPHAD